MLVIRKLDWYVGNRFLKMLLMAVTSFVVIFITVDIFEHFSRWVDKDIGFVTLARYYFYGLPYIVVLVMPIALLLCSLFLVGSLARKNEFVAMRAAGISIPRIFIPMFLIGFLVSIFVILIGDSTVSDGLHLQTQVKRVEIEGRDPVDYARRSSFAYRTLNGSILEIGYYDGSIATMRDVSIEWYDDSTHLIRRLLSPTIMWIDNSWVALETVDRQFGPGGSAYFRKYDSLPLPEIRELPEDFGSRQRSPEEMGFFQLISYIDRVKNAGGDIRGDLVELYLKFFFPLSNLIMVLVGAPLAARNPRSGKSINVGLAILLAFIFFSLLRLGQTLGHRGTLNPLLAASLADVIFIAVGTILLIKTSRT